MRYRRIPFRWKPLHQLPGGQDIYSLYFPSLKARVIPVLVRPDCSYTNDSTPVFLELEEAVKNGRGVVPTRPSDAFLAALLEDFADEWLSKIMFEGRFHTQRDASFGAAWQWWQGPSEAIRTGKLAPAMLDQLADRFAARQVGRRHLVVGTGGWTEMERCLRDVCGVVTEMLRAGQPFLFGSRPSNADFALFGQLRQLAADPLPSRIMHDYPAAWGWVWRMDDLGGLDVQPWPAAVSEPSVAVMALLRLAGDTYLPFLVANMQVYTGGQAEVAVTIRGGTVEHRQPAFKYQAAYCYPQLLQQYKSLAAWPGEQDRVRDLLQRTGCISAFEGSHGSGKARL